MGMSELNKRNKDGMPVKFRHRIFTLGCDFARKRWDGTKAVAAGETTAIGTDAANPRVNQ